MQKTPNNQEKTDHEQLLESKKPFDPNNPADVERAARESVERREILLSIQRAQLGRSLF